MFSWILIIHNVHWKCGYFIICRKGQCSSCEYLMIKDRVIVDGVKQNTVIKVIVKFNVNKTLNMDYKPSKEIRILVKS